MYQIPQTLPGFSGLGWAQNATLNISGGRVYHEFIFETGTIPANKLEQIILRLNGDDIVNLSGDDLVMLERYRKRYETAGVFVLYLSDLANAGIESRNVSGLVTFPTDQIELLVKVGSGSGSIDLKVSAQVSGLREGQQRQFVPRKYKFNVTAGQTLENSFANLTKGPAYQRIHFNAPVTRLEWKKDKVSVWERTAALNTAMLKRMDRAPQPGYFHFDAIESDFGIADLFRTDDVKTELLAKFDVSTAGNVPMLIECMEIVGNIGGQAA